MAEIERKLWVVTTVVIGILPVGFTCKDQKQKHKLAKPLCESFKQWCRKDQQQQRKHLP